jgi:hypothetical protein
VRADVCDHDDEVGVTEAAAEAAAARLRHVTDGMPGITRRRENATGRGGRLKGA